MYDTLSKVKIGYDQNLLNLREIDDNLYKGFQNDLFLEIKDAINQKDDGLLNCLLEKRLLSFVFYFCSEIDMDVADALAQFILYKIKDDPGKLKQVITMFADRSHPMDINGKIIPDVSFLQKFFGRHIKELCELVEKYRDKLVNVSNGALHKLCDDGWQKN